METGTFQAKGVVQFRRRGKSKLDARSIFSSTNDILERIAYYVMRPLGTESGAAAFVEGQRFATYKDLNLSCVSRSFRDAMRTTVDGVVLMVPRANSGKVITNVDLWKLLKPYPKIKAISVYSCEGFISKDFLHLWKNMKNHGRTLNALKLDIGNSLGLQALMGAMRKFGPDIQHLDLSFQKWNFAEDLDQEQRQIVGERNLTKQLENMELGIQMGRRKGYGMRTGRALDFTDSFWADLDKPVGDFAFVNANAVAHENHSDVMDDDFFNEELGLGSEAHEGVYSYNRRWLWWEPCPVAFTNYLYSREPPRVHLFNIRILEKILRSCPHLRTLRINVAQNLGMLSDDAISRMAEFMSQLEDVSIEGVACLTDEGISTLVESTPNLRVLKVVNCWQIGDPSALKVATSECSAHITSVEFESFTLIQEATVKLLVNNCPNLRHVKFERCRGIGSGALSHISCSRLLRSVSFTPATIGCDMNRCALYLSCTESIRRIQVGACGWLSMDAITALSRLPRLETIVLEGFSSAPPDMWYRLCQFAAIESIRITGKLNVTDRDIAVILTALGGRVRHLQLVDTFRTVTDEALDTVITFGNSLELLQLNGDFSQDAIRRLRLACPKLRARLNCAF
eukprot:Plantae.Rhodophyta-Hildenbrandia_rubra.ctg4854.p1 GENE.Plantae.Rhodophyta-Hildenbrandia_rubra.ctg4854~~Plantae.Rhodophyta-Hildenbrandia_rubra.ctg4854.p1  ORF type:complete len:626 (+),score=60.06 Plantae.Rhodophyta-Hildenbrandia_rubra.ctg4854:94-1971(+)